MAGTAADPLSATRERLRRLEQLRTEGILTEQEYAAKRAAILDEVVATPASPSPMPMRSAMRAEIERRTRHGWQVASESPDGVQLRKPKHFSFGWAIFWFVVGLVGFLIPFIIYLLWHWAKKDRYVFLSVAPDGTVVASDHSRLWAAVLAYARWSGARPQPWQRVVALGAPLVLLLVVASALISSAAAAGGGGSSGTANDAAASRGGGHPGAPVAAAVPTPTPQRLLGIGGTWYANSDGWDITVDSATTTGAFQGGIIGLPHVARGVYVAVTVTMTNTGNGAHSLGGNRFKLVNAAGQSYDASGFNHAYGGGSYNEDISFGTDVNPGESLDGMLFFDVPATVSGLQLKVIGGGVFALGDVLNGRLSTRAPGASSDGTSTTAAPALSVSPTTWPAALGAQPTPRAPDGGGQVAAPGAPSLPTQVAPVATPTTRPADSPTPSASATPWVPTPVVYHPSIALSPTSGPPGTVVVVSGTGFPANTTVAVFFLGATVDTLVDLPTNSAGQIRYTWMVPASDIPGGIAVEALGEWGVVEADFTVPPPTIVLIPSTAAVGQTVTIRGSGFSADQSFSVAAMELRLPLGSGTTSATGSFELTFTVPATSQATLTIIGGVTMVGSELVQVTLTIS